MDDNDWNSTRKGTFCFNRMMIDMGMNENESKKKNRIWTEIELENDAPDERNNLVWKHEQVNEIQWDQFSCKKHSAGLHTIYCDQPKWLYRQSNPCKTHSTHENIATN